MPKQKSKPTDAIAAAVEDAEKQIDAGEIDLALHRLEQALIECLHLHGEAHHNTVRVLNACGTAHRVKRDYTRAKAYHIRALGIVTNTQTLRRIIVRSDEAGMVPVAREAKRYASADAARQEIFTAAKEAAEAEAPARDALSESMLEKEREVAAAVKIQAHERGRAFRSRAGRVSPSRKGSRARQQTQEMMQLVAQKSWLQPAANAPAVKVTDRRGLVGALAGLAQDWAREAAAEDLPLASQQARVRGTAVGWYKALLEEHPPIADRLVYLDQLATVYSELCDYDTAIATLKRAAHLADVLQRDDLIALPAGAPSVKDIIARIDDATALGEAHRRDLAARKIQRTIHTYDAKRRWGVAARQLQRLGRGAAGRREAARLRPEIPEEAGGTASPVGSRGSRHTEDTTNTSALAIQRVGRGGAARSDLHTAWAEEQQWVREAAADAAADKGASTDDQRRRHRAARKIQARHRGNQGRAAAAAAAERKAKAAAAANERQQAAARAQAEAREKRERLGESVRSSQMATPKELSLSSLPEDDEDTRRRKAALKIQARQRGNVARQKLKEEQELKERAAEARQREAAAVRIQAHYRGYRARTEHEDARQRSVARATAKHREQEEAAAVKLQAVQRGRAARQKYRRMKLKKRSGGGGAGASDDNGEGTAAQELSTDAPPAEARGDGEDGVAAENPASDDGVGAGTGATFPPLQRKSSGGGGGGGAMGSEGAAEEEEARGGVRKPPHRRGGGGGRAARPAPAPRRGSTTASDFWSEIDDDDLPPMLRGGQRPSPPVKILGPRKRRPPWQRHGPTVRNSECPPPPDPVALREFAREQDVCHDLMASKPRFRTAQYIEFEARKFVPEMSAAAQDTTISPARNREGMQGVGGEPTTYLPVLRPKNTNRNKSTNAKSSSSSNNKRKGTDTSMRGKRAAATAATGGKAGNGKKTKVSAAARPTPPATPGTSERASRMCNEDAASGQLVAVPDRPTVLVEAVQLPLALQTVSSVGATTLYSQATNKHSTPRRPPSEIDKFFRMGRARVERLDFLGNGRAREIMVQLTPKAPSSVPRARSTRGGQTYQNPAHYRPQTYNQERYMSHLAATAPARPRGSPRRARSPPRLYDVNNTSVWDDWEEMTCLQTVSRIRGLLRNYQHQKLMKSDAMYERMLALQDSNKVILLRDYFDPWMSYYVARDDVRRLRAAQVSQLRTANCRMVLKRYAGALRKHMRVQLWVSFTSYGLIKRTWWRWHKYAILKSNEAAVRRQMHEVRDLQALNINRFVQRHLHTLARYVAHRREARARKAIRNHEASTFTYRFLTRDMHWTMPLPGLEVLLTAAVGLPEAAPGVPHAMKEMELTLRDMRRDASYERRTLATFDFNRRHFHLRMRSLFNTWVRSTILLMQKKTCDGVPRSRPAESFNREKSAHSLSRRAEIAYLRRFFYKLGHYAARRQACESGTSVAPDQYCPCHGLPVLLCKVHAARALQQGERKNKVLKFLQAYTYLTTPVDTSLRARAALAWRPLAPPSSK